MITQNEQEPPNILHPVCLYLNDIEKILAIFSEAERATSPPDSFGGGATSRATFQVGNQICDDPGDLKHSRTGARE
jgi:hypothetical protein